jgi:hypothetical protein
MARVIRQILRAEALLGIGFIFGCAFGGFIASSSWGAVKILAAAWL